MKIKYQIRDNYIEVIRCYGTDSRVVIPEQIAGFPVREIAAYAFSQQKDAEEEDVCVYETGENGMFPEQEKLLAGPVVQEIVFPDTVEGIGNYIFYGCKELGCLEFSDTLMSIGSGAFTGCGRLSELHVHLNQGKKSCVKEILGDLWQRIDVTFYVKNGENAENEYSQVRLVFPEHYEEAVENTPARILFTQHHGTGNNYRQCFYNREMDYRKYDELFPLARAQDKIEVLADMAFDRLVYAWDLTEVHRQMYERYISGHLPEIVQLLVKGEQMGRLQFLSGSALWSRDALDAAIEAAYEYEKGEFLSFLMNEKHQMFPMQKKKRFEL